MADLLRILAALMLLYMQQLGRAPSKLYPVVSVPTATASPTNTPTRTPSSTPTDTPRPTATASYTPTRRPAVLDPTGFDVVGVPPAQKLPSAILIYPLVRVSATQDTRIELMNLTTSSLSVQCFYVTSPSCNEVGFSVSLTANQPISWNASNGRGGSAQRLAPSFSGDGELKCLVIPRSTDPSSYNALQGRALVSDTTDVGAGPPQTVGYNAIGFRRLAPGSFDGVVSLDGVNYEQCPDRLHFHVLAGQPSSASEMVLVPCSQDLMNQIPSKANIQLSIINELENILSGSTSVTCFNRIKFNSTSALKKGAIGTETAHVIVRGTDVPVVGLVIDRFTVPGGAVSASSNEPYLEGGRSASVNLP